MEQMLRNGLRKGVGALHTTDILVARLRVIWLGARVHRARIVPLPDLRVAVGKRKTSAIVVVPSECREIAPHVVRGAVGPGEPNEVIQDCGGPNRSFCFPVASLLHPLRHLVCQPVSRKSRLPFRHHLRGFAVSLRQLHRRISTNASLQFAMQIRFLNSNTPALQAPVLRGFGFLQFLQRFPRVL